MKRFAKKQWVIFGLVAVVAGMAAFGAYAYWTASGTGQGTASVGTDNGVTIVVTNMGAALYPAGPPPSRSMSRTTRRPLRSWLARSCRTAR